MVDELLTLIYGLHRHLTVVSYSSKEIEQDVADAKPNSAFTPKIQDCLNLMILFIVRL